MRSLQLQDDQSHLMLALCSDSYTIQWYVCLYSSSSNIYAHIYTSKFFQLLWIANECLRTGAYLKERKPQEDGENCIPRSSIICTFHQISLKWSFQGWWDGWVM